MGGPFGAKGDSESPPSLKSFPIGNAGFFLRIALNCPSRGGGRCLDHFGHNCKYNIVIALTLWVV